MPQLVSGQGRPRRKPVADGRGSDERSRGGKRSRGSEASAFLTMFYKTCRFDWGTSIVYPSYMSRIVFTVLGLLGIGISAVAQTAAPSRFVGTVTAIKVDTAEIVVKPDNAAPVSAKLTSDTVVERVEPGAKDLKGAQAMQASDISVGDRVLVVLMPGVPVLRRIVDMSAVDINKKNEADRLDWTKRGISGVVAAKTGNEI